MSIQKGDEIMFMRDSKHIVTERLPGKLPSGQVFGCLHRPGAQPLDIDRARAEVKKIRAKRYDGLGGNEAE